MIKKHFCGRHFCQEILKRHFTILIYFILTGFFLYEKKTRNTQRLQDVNKSSKDYKGF